jgi:hypothetical protein
MAPPLNPRITAVQPLRPYLVALTFTDGSRGVVDLEPWIRRGGEVFGPLQAPALFAQVRVDPEAGTIVWPNGADLDPDVLFEAAHPARTAT